jgi:hypothetical protein
LRKARQNLARAVANPSGQPHPKDNLSPGKPFKSTGAKPLAESRIFARPHEILSVKCGVKMASLPIVLIVPGGVSA